MNEYILFGLYGAAIMCLITLIKSLITKKQDPTIIPNTIFGFVSGSVGMYLINAIMRELYPLSPVWAIVMIVLLCLGILATVISLVLRRVE